MKENHQRNDRRIGFTPMLLSCLLAIACMPGCDGGPPVGKVTGVVRVEGEPVGPGTIMFDPAPGEGTIGPSAVGDIQEDGAYSVGRSQGREGAIVGNYRVMILPNTKESYGEEGVEPNKGSDKINARYMDIKKSGLTATVKPGDNVINFDLEP